MRSGIPLRTSSKLLEETSPCGVTVAYVVDDSRGTEHAGIKFIHIHIHIHILIESLI